MAERARMVVDDAPSGAAGARLRPYPWPGMLAGLALALAGGLVFDALRWPLAWMLGGMVFCLIAALLGARLAPPPEPLAEGVRVLLGVLLGASFSPALLQDWGDLLLGLGLLPLHVTLCALVALPWLRMRYRLDPATAYFSVMPGGLYTMVLLGQEAGGDGRTISLAHGTRVLLLVATAPLLVEWLQGIDLPPRPVAGGSIQDLSPGQAALLLASGLIGWWGGRRLRLPGSAVTGPMLASGVLHLSGLATATVPSLLVILAQWILGAVLGARYVGLTWGELRRTGQLCLELYLALMLVTGGVALAAGLVSGRPGMELFLAFAPGGLAEMSLIALALGYQAAFVSLMHAARILLIVAGAPLVWRWMRPR